MHDLCAARGKEFAVDAFSSVADILERCILGPGPLQDTGSNSMLHSRRTVTCCACHVQYSMYSAVQSRVVGGQRHDFLLLIAEI